MRGGWKAPWWKSNPRLCLCLVAVTSLLLLGAAFWSHSARNASARLQRATHEKQIGVLLGEIEECKQWPEKRLKLEIPDLSSIPEARRAAAVTPGFGDVTAPAPRNQLPRLAIVTFLNGAGLSSLSMHMSAISCYAATHGYPLYTETMRLEANLEANFHYNKPRAILKYLPFVQWVVFIDADCVPVNRSIPLERFLDDRFDVIVPDRHHGEMHPGIAIKNSKFSFQFLEDWLKYGQQGFVFNGDNGIYHDLVFRAALPDRHFACQSQYDSVRWKHLVRQSDPDFSEIWHSYWGWIKCLRAELSEESGEFPPHIKLLRPGFSWLRDDLWPGEAGYKYLLPSDVFLHTKLAAYFTTYRDVYCLPVEDGMSRPDRLAPKEVMPSFRKYLPALFGEPNSYQYEYLKWVDTPQKYPGRDG